VESSSQDLSRPPLYLGRCTGRAAEEREGGAILRGERKPARALEVPEPDVAELRGRLGLSQSKFAALIGISVRTLRA